MQDYEDYAALAYQADQAALTASTRIAKSCWKTLAEKYRKLAAQQSQAPRPDKKGQKR